VDTERDALYSYDPAEQKAFQEAKPWKKDPHYFKHVRISSVALMKMVMHARSGGALEVMGLMMGKIAGDTFVVTDAFRLPVEGTETRVNASEQAIEYIVQYFQTCRDSGTPDNAVGWYHSHPGYGCWLSGIDVSTQASQQMYQDPFLAVVIDPNRTVSAGKVEIGAFRTFPDDYKPVQHASAEGGGGGQGIPLTKADDFGAHAHRYYPLEISHYKSTLDTRLLELLWNKYWVSTLSQTPLETNHEYGTAQMQDLAQKVRNAERGVKTVSRHGEVVGADNALDKVVRESNKIAAEENRGLMAANIKTNLFGGIAHDMPRDDAK